MANAGSRSSNNDNDNNNSDNSGSPSSSEKQASGNDPILERNLERMEALLRQSALGVHILFDNHAIAKVMSEKNDDKDFFDFEKMKKVQDCMTALISQKTYFDKIDYLQKLDPGSYEMLVRTYFHIVENTVKSSSPLSH